MYVTLINHNPQILHHAVVDAEYKEILCSSEEVEQIELNSEGCNLSPVSVTVLLNSCYSYDYVMHSSQIAWYRLFWTPTGISGNLKAPFIGSDQEYMKTGAYLKLFCTFCFLLC